MSIEAMKQVIELYDEHCYNNDHGGIEFSKKHGYKFIEAIEALRTAVQQTDAHAQAVATEPVWFHKHWCDGDDIFYRPDDRIPPGSTPLYVHSAPCVPAGYALVPMTEDQRTALWLDSPVDASWATAEDAYKQGIQDAEAHHGITAQANEGGE